MNDLAHDMIEMQRGPVTPILSKALRAMLIAGGRDKRLVGADFANIEGRVNAWMAGEDWKLAAFRAYDEGTGPDLYKLAYSRSFGVAINDIAKPQRQIGKTQELAFGYQGSCGAWLRFDPDPSNVTRIVREQTYGSEAWRKAADQYDRATNHMGLAPDQWVAIKVAVNNWRSDNAKIVQSWWDRQDAAIEAVDSPGRIVPLFDGKIQYLVAEGFLWCRLPSGKLLAYCRPRLVETREDFLVDADGEMFPLEEFSTEEIDARVAAGATVREGRRRTQVAFDGKNQKTNHWGQQRLYGGLQTNNDVQGTARELLRIAMIRVEEAGYPIVLHVHDSIASEVSQEFGSVEHYESLLSILPPWAAGLPLTAKGGENYRFII
jgi:DNA polymerase bacteriophage-type